MNRREGGFSLIEVLIAAFIMFIALAVFTSVFRGALLSSKIATDSINSTALTGIVVDSISSKLTKNHQSEEMKGQEKLLHKTLSWSAKVIKKTKPPARLFAQELVQPEHEAKIWQVTLVDDQSNQQFIYEEITW